MSTSFILNRQASWLDDEPDNPQAQRGQLPPLEVIVRPKQRVSASAERQLRLPLTPPTWHLEPAA